MSAHSELGYRAPLDAGQVAGHGRPVAGCGNAVTRGALFCPEHHFALPPGYARAVLRARIKCQRAEPGVVKTRLEKTFQGLLSGCLSLLSARGVRQ